MKHIIEKYNNITGKDVKFETVENMIKHLQTSEDVPAADKISFIQEIFQRAEERMTEEGITYDYDFIYNTDMVKNAQAKVAELGDMMIDIPIKFKQLKVIEKEFFEELSCSGNKLAKIVSLGVKGDSSALLRTFVTDGYKIRLDGKIIGFNKPSLFDGITDYEEQFNSAVQGRIPSIINASAVGSAGYIFRKMEFLFSFLVLQTSESAECEPLFEIELTKENRKSYLGRNYAAGFINEDTAVGSYKLYSPVFCRSTEEGKHSVCTKCAGKLSDNWKSLDSINTIFSVVTERLTQSLLAAKHLIKVNLQSYDGIEYLRTDNFKMTKEFGISEEGLLTKDGITVPFMKQDLEWVDEDNGLIKSSEGWWSLDTKSMLPHAKALFNKTQRFKDINDPAELVKEFLVFDKFARLGVQSLFYELIVSMQNRTVEDMSILARNAPNAESIILPPTTAILNNGHLDSLFFEQLNKQLSSPRFHHKPLNRDGGLYEIFLGGQDNA